jgi:hypothetical protein
MKKVPLFLKFLCLIAALNCHAEDRIIHANQSPVDDNSPYAIKMIELALKKIDNKYQLQISKEDLTQARIREEVKTHGRLDIAWGSSNAEVEQIVRPVRIPLFKGLLGHRIFLINKMSQYKFNQIQTLDDLKKLTFGQGKTWADTRILEANGFKLVKANKTTSIFYMVEGGRFDAFPRGVMEPFNELKKYSNLPDLAVENSIMLVYKMPFYLFVAPDNVTLANDLELGLNRAIADGSFDEVFYNDPRVKDVFEKANMKNRKIFYLQNPLLSSETPVDRKELWLDINSLP